MYLVAKGKALVMRLEKKLLRQCRWSTDTPPIPYPYCTDGSLIHCRHPTNAIVMTVHQYIDQNLTNPQPTVKCHLADLSRPTLDRHSTDVVTNIVTDCQRRCQPVYCLTPPIRDMIHKLHRNLQCRL